MVFPNTKYLKVTKKRCKRQKRFLDTFKGVGLNYTLLRKYCRELNFVLDIQVCLHEKCRKINTLHGDLK